MISHLRDIAETTAETIGFIAFMAVIMWGVVIWDWMVAQ